MKSILNEIYNQLNILTSQPECEFCSHCEKNVGLVYVLADEIFVLKNLSINLINTGKEVSYIDRIQDIQNSSDWWCPCFDTLSLKCNIYKHRPLCCRLYPLDLMKIDIDYYWVIHNECPISKRILSNNSLNFIYEIINQMEKIIDPKIFSLLKKQDKLCKTIEFFSIAENNITKVSKYGQVSIFP
jgi:Fe-S-cluster containining protein